MVLQQFAQDKQSVFAHISVSAATANLSSPRGGFFSSFVRNLLNADLFSLTFFRNSRKLIFSKLKIKN